MPVSFPFDQLYKQVREIGLPYQINEAGGSVVIKISSNIYQKQFSKPREKFRFNSTRTFNGSDTLNWRSPENYQEASTLFFPNINFFRSTPPPTMRPSVSTPPAVSSSLSNIKYSAPPPPTRSSAPHPPSPTLATLPPARSSTTPPPSETSTRLPTTPSYFPAEFSTQNIIAFFFRQYSIP